MSQRLVQREGESRKLRPAQAFCAEAQENDGERKSLEHFGFLRGGLLTVLSRRLYWD